jgi:hypothetical protein
LRNSVYEHNDFIICCSIGSIASGEGVRNADPEWMLAEGGNEELAALISKAAKKKGETLGRLNRPLHLSRRATTTRPSLKTPLRYFSTIE